MEQDKEYRQQLLLGYRKTAEPLFCYLPWLEKAVGTAVSSIYGDREIAENSVTFPVYDGTILRFVKEAAATGLMDKNYRYIYTRNHIRNHDDERHMIAGAGLKEWDILRGILSYYVLGGRTKAMLWSEGAREGIFYLVLKKMKEIIEFWDEPVNCR